MQDYSSDQHCEWIFEVKTELEYVIEFELTSMANTDIQASFVEHNYDFLYLKHCHTVVGQQTCTTEYGTHGADGVGYETWEAPASLLTRQIVMGETSQVKIEFFSDGSVTQNGFQLKQNGTYLFQTYHDVGPVNAYRVSKLFPIPEGS